jgi:hypothetical protein
MSEAEAQDVHCFRPANDAHDYFTAFFSALPAENFGTFFAAILISFPVWGFRPTRAFRLPTLNVPKPTSVIACPFFSAFVMVSKTHETASSAFLLLPTSLATSTTRSALFTPLHPLSPWIHKNATPILKEI